MKILFITLACKKSDESANQHSYRDLQHGTNETACRRQQRLLPIQLLSLVGELIDAGHQVHWPDESLNYQNKDRLIADANLFNPDVLFFACGDQRTQSLMASVAVKTNSVLGNQFINEETMRPARQWCDALTDQDISVDLLLEKLSAV